MVSSLVGLYQLPLMKKAIPIKQLTDPYSISLNLFVLCLMSSAFPRVSWILGKKKKKKKFFWGFFCNLFFHPKGLTPFQLIGYYSLLPLYRTRWSRAGYLMLFILFLGYAYILLFPWLGRKFLDFLSRAKLAIQRKIKTKLRWQKNPGHFSLFPFFGGEFNESSTKKKKSRLKNEKLKFVDYFFGICCDY